MQEELGSGLRLLEALNAATTLASQESKATMTSDRRQSIQGSSSDRGVWQHLLHAAVRSMRQSYVPESKGVSCSTGHPTSPPPPPPPPPPLSFLAVSLHADVREEQLKLKLKLITKRGGSRIYVQPYGQCSARWGEHQLLTSAFLYSRSSGLQAACECAKNSS